MEQPILRLGLIGFATPVHTALGEWLARDVDGWPQWKIAPFDKADAWFINGRSITNFDKHSLTIETGLRAQPWVRVTVAEMSRPIAFAGKTPSALDVLEQVDLSDDNSLRKQLQNFEAWLRPLRAQFALGADLVEREAELRPSIYQVTLSGRLLAVIDLFKWRAGILPTARPVDFSQGVWDRRPPLAGSIPPSFIAMPVAQLMWIYATRTRRDVLPQRYRKHKIHLRRVPRLPINWLYDEHLLLLRELRARAHTLKTLREITGIDEPRLARHLAPLYYAGAITTDPRKAGSAGKFRQAEAEPSVPGLNSVPARQGLESEFANQTGFGLDNSRYLTDEDLTAPVPLRH